MTPTDWKQKRDAYLTDRVIDQITWYGKKSGINKKWYYYSRITVIVSGALIPFLISFSDNGFEVLKYVASALGVVVSISEGIMSLKKYLENWAIYRSTAEKLKREQLMFENNVGPDYSAGDEEAFKHFVLRVEKITSEENEEWTSQLRSNQSQQQQQARQVQAPGVPPPPPPPEEGNADDAENAS